MSETMKFQCHIKISDNNLKNLTKEPVEIQFMDKTATIDSNGEAIFDCEISQKDICKSFPVKIHSETYIIIGTGQCHPMSHRNNTNPFSLSLDKESTIKSIEISKEKEQSHTNPKEHIAIYTAEAQKPSDSNDSNADSQNPNMIYLRANLTSGVLKRDIKWAYYVKDKDEHLWDSSKINKDNLNKFSSLQSSDSKPAFESILERNIQIRFDINAKFKYTIKENGTQKEIEDYLPNNKQLVIFAYKNNPAYKVGDNITHATLNISSSPILEINYNTITILHKDIKKSFDIDISPKLICNMQNDKIYTLEFNIQNDYLTLKTNNNKLYKIYKPQESTNNITENNNADSIYLKDNNSFDEIKNTLKLTKENANVYVLTKWQITLLMLQEVFEYTKANNESKQRMDTMLTEIANELNRIKDDKPMYVHYHLDSRARLEHFFAQCCVEVEGRAFRLEEDLNYTTANRLREVFANTFKNDSAKADELIALKSGRAKAIANYVYSDKNGNEGGDDGWDFRGRGIKQLTGRNNYAGFQSFYNANNPNNKKDFLNNEEYRKELITNGRVALLSAVWFWNDKKYPNKGKIVAWQGKYLYEIADDETNGNKTTQAIDNTSKQNINLTQSQRVISILVNGGTNGLTDRRDAYNRINNNDIFKNFN